MNSIRVYRRRRKPSPAEWANLPSELLEIIYGNLKDFPAEKLRFRWICRWWRLSTPPPPNKLAPWFPLKLSIFASQSADLRFDSTITADAVYLVRSRSNPAKSCLVSLHEASVGNLVLRHPLCYNRIYDSDSDSDTDSESDSDSDWIFSTQTLVSRSFAYSEFCGDCDQISRRLKVAIVVESESGSGFVGLCGFPPRNRGLDSSGMELFAFRSEFDGRAIPGHTIHGWFFSGDYTTFNGRIIAVDKRRRIYVLDHTSMELVQLNAIAQPSCTRYTVCSTLEYLVVSDGELYLVSIIIELRNNRTTCQIHRLHVMKDRHGGQEVSVEAEEVEDLGDDRVFFVGLTRSFSVSAKDLPPPWTGNCVVYHGRFRCGCHFRPTCARHEIIFLGGGPSSCFVSVSSLQGYSELLSPGLLLSQIKDLDHQAGLADP